MKAKIFVPEYQGRNISSICAVFVFFLKAFAPSEYIPSHSAKFAAAISPLNAAARLAAQKYYQILYLSLWFTAWWSWYITSLKNQIFLKETHYETLHRSSFFFSISELWLTFYKPIKCIFFCKERQKF